MSYHLRVLCRGPSPVTADEIREFVKAGCYFESEPEFHSTEADLPSETSGWNLTIRYHKDRRPVLVSCTTGAHALAEELDELREVAAELEPDAAVTIARHLSEVCQIIAFDVDRPRLAGNAWDMLDSLEAYLASNYDGIIYAPDDGFFDASLQLIAKVEE